MRWRHRQECILERADGQPDRISVQIVGHVTMFNFTEVTPGGWSVMLRLDDSSETQRVVVEFACVVLSSVGP